MMPGMPARRRRVPSIPELGQTRLFQSAALAFREPLALEAGKDLLDQTFAFRFFLQLEMLDRDIETILLRMPLMFNRRFPGHLFTSRRLAPMQARSKADETTHDREAETRHHRDGGDRTQGKHPNLMFGLIVHVPLLDCLPPTPDRRSCSGARHDPETLPISRNWRSVRRPMAGIAAH